MLIIETDQDGNIAHINQVADLPSDYTCSEWRAYDDACDQAQATGQAWTQQQAETYAAYQNAMRARAGSEE
ncbi:MAG TPA: hypothetical protein VKX46_05070 [Ktedonobacteraceae bacterium]|nr:hypothetical protein [Ktedonobacteraceae bacterium]